MDNPKPAEIFDRVRMLAPSLPERLFQDLYDESGTIKQLSELLLLGLMSPVEVVGWIHTQTALWNQQISPNSC